MGRDGWVGSGGDGGWGKGEDDGVKRDMRASR